MNSAAGLAVAMPFLIIAAGMADARTATGEAAPILLAQLASGSGDQSRDPGFPGIDPIITGNTVDDKSRKEWEDRAKRYRECKECVTPQPYPGDLPE